MTSAVGSKMEMEEGEILEVCLETEMEEVCLETEILVVFLETEVTLEVYLVLMVDYLGGTVEVSVCKDYFSSIDISSTLFLLRFGLLRDINRVKSLLMKYLSQYC